MGAAALPVAVGLQVAGGVYGAESAKAGGLAQEGYYRSLAATSDSNARLTEISGEKQARSIQDAASAEYVRLSRDVKRVGGAQRSAAAANGIAGSVTAEDIARDTADTAKLDEMAIRYNADSQSEEILRQAGVAAFNLRSDAEGYRMAGSQAKAAGNRAAVASLIGAATSVGSTFAMASPRTPAAPGKAAAVAGKGPYSGKPLTYSPQPGRFSTNSKLSLGYY